MMFLEYVTIAFSVLRTHKFRAALTVLSIAIGAFSVVLMTSLAKSGLATLARGIEELGGARIIAIAPKPPERAREKKASYQRGLTREDVQEALARVPQLASGALLAELGEKPARSGGRQAVTDFMASTAGFGETYNIRAAKGRELREEDDLGQRRVCFIGKDTAFALFGDEEAVGRQVTIEGESYRVVGVAAKVNRFGVSFGWDWNNFLVVPHRTLYPQGGAGAAQSASFSFAMFKTTGAEKNEIAKRIVNALYVARHRGVDDYVIYDFAVGMAKFEKVFFIMEVIVGALAGIALLVGGVGVMNILLVSVRERVREIGVRKAIGASAAAVRAQFIVEAAVLGAFGGVTGAALGVAGALGAGQIIMRYQEQWVPLVSSGAIAAAILSSLAIGGVFGVIPARRAGKLDPVECLRS